MTPSPPTDPQRFITEIRRSGLSIYDPIVIGDPALWIPTPELQAVLDKGLRGISLAGLKNRTRSKVAKQHVCRTLGYPTPNSFKRTRPRFVGQMFDTYVQKWNNLQVWNEDLNPTRRYVLIRVNEGDIITRVKVVTGAALAPLDTTGCLTQKYQATCIPGNSAADLIVEEDTPLLRPFTVANFDLSDAAKPINHPIAGQILTVYKSRRPISLP
jgi:hypothetical protein